MLNDELNYWESYIYDKLDEYNADTVGIPRNTIHRYFFSGVAGGFLRVPEKDWPSVAILPTEKFVDIRGQPFPNHKAWSKS